MKTYCIDLNMRVHFVPYVLRLKFILGIESLNLSSK
jgi:hypothetical protein